MSRFIVKLSGAGRFDGEYDGGATLDDAHVEAWYFRGYVPKSADVKICQADRDGRLYVLEYVYGCPVATSTV